MTAEPNKPKLSERLHEWQGHLKYLHKLVKADPGSAWDYWKVSYKEQPALQQALAELQQRSQMDNFDWDEVPNILQHFHLRPEDQGQADWYRDAKKQYQLVLAHMESVDTFKPAMIERVMKELKFIAEADTFHQQFGLVELQKKVKTMYNALQYRIDEVQKLQKHHLELANKEKELEIAKVKEATLAAENAKLAMQQRIEMEQRLKISEDKKRLEAKREADEAERLRIDKQQEYDAEMAEKRRREELSASFQAMQEKELMQKALATISLQQHAEAIAEFLRNHEKLSGDDFATAALLFDVLRKKFTPG